MKITTEKIKKQLLENYGWSDFKSFPSQDAMVTELISDTLKIVDDILLREKGISIKGKKV